MSQIDKVAVLDFGGQYTHLITNRLRRLGVYSEIVTTDVSAENLKGYKGIILSGSPHSTLDSQSPTFDPSILALNIPVLGLCYGHQLLAKTLGATISRGLHREYGRARMEVKHASPLFKGLQESEQIWMSHGDAVNTLPEGFEIIGSTPDCATAAVCNREKNFYGLQFHPEVTDTPRGMTILDNFLDICNCSKNWNSQTFIDEISNQIKTAAGDRSVFLLVSGGVDSTVAFTLLNQVLGPKRVLGLHIDNGLMRQDESADVITYMKEHGFDNLKIYDGSDDFLQALDGVIDPEQKRGIIGRMFITVKEKAFAQLDLDADRWLLAQGTIYPDTIESAGTKHADLIKTHHNRVDIIMELIERGLIIEPLAQLYKDEVRELGEALGLPKKLVWRHPFPGPGLGVRVLCSDGVVEQIPQNDKDKLQQIIQSTPFSAQVLPIRSVGVQGDGRTYAHPVLLKGNMDWIALEDISTKITNGVKCVNRVLFGIKTGQKGTYQLTKSCINRQRLDTLRLIDAKITQILQDSGEYDSIWQMPVVLLPLTNENGDECVVLRPIVSQEAMTARFVPLKKETFEKIISAASAIDGIGDLFFDITHKPPATIEWE